MNTFLIKFTTIGLLVACLLGCNVQHAPHAPNDPDAMKVIDQMAKVYADCQSYSDSGSVTTVFHTDQGDDTVVKPFSTALVRPGKFRFEFTEQGDPQSRYIVWQDGSDVRTWWDLENQTERVDSLGLALAGATGVSSGSAHTIPSLLMPAEVGGRLITDLQAAKLANKQMLGQHSCLTIKALHADDPITIWIDEESFLVRRIDSMTKFDDFTTTDSTVYDPVVDQEVDPKSLEFNALQE